MAGGISPEFASKGLRGAPDRQGDVSSDIVEITDPTHPLFGRRFDIVSVDTVTCGESRVRVKYRFGLTLVLPISVTDLAPATLNILMVGMGMPRQEIWLARNYDALPICVACRP